MKSLSSIRGWLSLVSFALPGFCSQLCADPTQVGAPDFFAHQIQPLLGTTCTECHSTAKHKGDLDLERFGTVEAMRREPKVWEEVASQVASGEMPPRDAKLATPMKPELRDAFLKGVNAVLDDVAASLAGDPGPVVLRRLSNAEYTYTIRDLTGIPTLDPVREFPADGASGEGFMNVGNSLVMSSSLVSKYLDAAKSVANHAMLVPDGFRFSPYTTTRDWTDALVGEIRDLYRTYTDPRGGDTVNLQGIVFSTNEGGRLPVDKYLSASLECREESSDERVSQVAHSHGLSAKYLRILVQALNSTSPSLLLDPIRVHWRMAKASDVPAIASEVGVWQKALWKFSSVGHIGKLNGPKAWMEPVTPLANLQEFRMKLAPTNSTQPVTVYLVVGDVGDGNGQDIAVWERPRLALPGRPEIMVRAVQSAASAAVSNSASTVTNAAVSSGVWGLDPSLFGHDLGGKPFEPESLVVRAPAVFEVRIPAELAAGAEFVTTGRLAPGVGDGGSVQFQITTNRPSVGTGVWETGTQVTETGGVWTSDHRRLSMGSPIIVSDGGPARSQYEASMEEFRQLFPAALCYTKIVPVDEVVTLTLFFREDDVLARLMLEDAEQMRLDRLWSELHFVSRDALTLVDGFEQLWQFATQDADPKVFEPLREPILRRAAEFRQALTNAQPRHLEAVLDWARLAYRRPLRDEERTELKQLYQSLRSEELSHEDAIRLTLARVLISPSFLYHAESPVPGNGQGPISSLELANRLSYFLWSSAPDSELRAAAENGALSESKAVSTQSQRLLRDPKVRRLATEFACAWLHLYGFDESAEKSERHFPTFGGLRGAMYEETIQFFTDFFQNDRSVLELLDGDATFLNAALAQHYGIPGVEGAQWRRVEGIKSHGRGGVLTQASVLAQNSGASRTSPILRGNWVSEVLLGEKLPRPPKDVPKLPEDEDTSALSMRELTQKHSSDPRCAGCHIRIDGFGLALERFDTIGRLRERDSANHVIDSHGVLQDGTTIDGVDGLRQYLLHENRDAFVAQFCRKLLGYALGRSVQLSDRPLLLEMRKQLEVHQYRVSAAVDVIIGSRQFREIRGRDFVSAE